MTTSRSLIAVSALLFAIVSALTSLAEGATGNPNVLDIGSRLEPLMDDWLIDQMTGMALRLHHPRSQEVSITFDAPWEGPVSGYVTVFRDTDRYRMYYRGCSLNPGGHEVTCYAESLDGIHWTRPELGLCEFEGSRRNNIILVGAGTHCFAVFKDDNPNAADDQRYKAVTTHSVNKKSVMMAYVSPDGLRWRLMSDEPIITRGAFDSQNTAHWNAARGCYIAYVRDFRDGIRSIRTCTSSDFINWTQPVWLDFGDAPAEHLYTNAVTPYFRAPHLLIGMPMRYHPDRQFIPTHLHKGASDGVFMTSRDGLHWNRRFLEALIRPGPDVSNWTDRSNMPAWGVVPTGDEEMSVYWIEHYRASGTRLRRGTLRTDGFVSACAPYAGGEFVTRPFVFAGNRLVINYATSAAGSVRVEIQTPEGRPMEGYRLADAIELYGDEMARDYPWQSGVDVGKLAGRPIRLRFVMKDADLYSIQFRNK